MKLTVLVDNNTYIDQYYLGEPAFCCLLEAEGKKILFDTGYSDIFLKNAEKMGIDLRDQRGAKCSLTHCGLQSLGKTLKSAQHIPRLHGLFVNRDLVDRDGGTMVTLADLPYDFSHLLAAGVEADVLITVGHFIHGGYNLKAMLQKRFSTGSLSAVTATGTQRNYQCKSHRQSKYSFLHGVCTYLPTISYKAQSWFVW